MTAVWGPLGWMTLHSMATSYPEVPTEKEMTLMTLWLDLFRDTITCPNCKEHFTTMLGNYKQLYPRFLANRQSFAIFTFRAHNAVNLRLNKPTYPSVAECMAQLHKNIQGKSAKEYRNAYLNHIYRYWRTMQDVTGIVATRKINEMRKIESEYMSLRDTNFAVSFAEEPVLFPRHVMERSRDGYSEESSQSLLRRPGTAPPQVGLRMTAHGFRLVR